MIILTVALHVKVSDSIVEVSVCYCVCITSNFTNMGEKLPGGATYIPGRFFAVNVVDGTT